MYRQIEKYYLQAAEIGYFQLNDFLHTAADAHRSGSHSIVTHLDGAIVLVEVKENYSSAVAELHCLHVYRGEHVLKCDFHQLYMALFRLTEVIENNQRRSHN